VEYVEVRLMDLNPFEPVGIDAPTMHFLDVFLLHCLLSESAQDTPEEIAANARNQHRVAGRGRAPELMLESLSGERTLNDWAQQLMQECEPIALALDAALGGSAHRDSLQAAHQALLQPDRTPSARVLQAMQDANNVFVRFVLPQSFAHRAYLSGLPFSAEAIARYAQMAADSVAQQHAIEAGDTMPFEIYRQHYLSRDRLGI
jgi:glutamate--cysteine ligase